ncbi:MAG: 50S ribosomal protein L31, partial [Opitutales bacterium]|nr:50S ribosomal protein L31 [Opitutales bacterium]
MKDNIRPEVHPVCFVDVSSGARFVTTSTMKSKNVENIDGVDCFMITRDVTADSH